MSPTIDNARRHLALAQLLLSCSAPTSIDEAVLHAEEAVRAVKALRDEARGRFGSRAGKVEHISAPIARAVEHLKAGG